MNQRLTTFDTSGHILEILDKQRIFVPPVSIFLTPLRHSSLPGTKQEQDMQVCLMHNACSAAGTVVIAKFEWCTDRVGHGARKSRVGNLNWKWGDFKEDLLSVEFVRLEDLFLVVV
jgi:hypothetical protein